MQSGNHYDRNMAFVGGFGEEQRERREEVKTEHQKLSI